jgi:predicted Rossmann-fold nucleotide-binding protein
MSIGFSPAASLREHTKKYRLPIGFFDYVNFTGMRYIGRDIHLVQSSDAVITVGGRMGSLHEFTTALEAHMPCGVLLGSGGLADVIPELLEKLEEPSGSIVVYDTDPEKLVKKIVKILDEQNKDLKLDRIADEWMVKASICEPLAGKYGFNQDKSTISKRMG